MNTKWCMACVGLLAALALPALAQDVIQPTAVSSVKALGPDAQVLSYGVVGEREVVVIQSDPMDLRLGAGRNGVSASVVVSSHGRIEREIPLVQMLPIPTGFGGGHLYYATAQSGHVVSHLLDIETGVSRELFSDLQPWQATRGGQELAIVGQGEDGALYLRVMSGGGLNEIKESRLEPGFPFARFGTLLSYAASGDLMLIDCMQASVTRIDPQTGQFASETVALEGSEVERSKSWPVPRTSERRPNQRQRVILAHVASMGSDFYFLGPYGGAEGYRVAEFDADGRQVWRANLKVLGYQPSDPRSGTLRSTTVASLGGDIAIVSASGARRTYRR